MVTSRIELIELIKDAFKNVSREGGVSWSETNVVDDYGTEEERRQARERDTDTNWLEVAAIPRFREDGGWGSFSFLDAIGFRYYLPAAMLQSLMLERSKVCDVFDFSEVCSLIDGISDPGALHYGAYLLLSDPQKSAIGNYIAYHEAVELAQTSILDFELFDALDQNVRCEYLAAVVADIVREEWEWQCT